MVARQAAVQASPEARSTQWIVVCRTRLAFGHWAAGLEEGHLDDYAAAVGVRPKALRDDRRVYLAHEPEAKAIVVGEREPRASWTVYRDAIHLGLDAFERTCELVALQNAENAERAPMAVTTRLVREVAGKEAFDRPSYGKRARRDGKDSATRRADDVEENLSVKDTRKELARRKKDAAEERRNEKMARKMAADIDDRVAKKIRAGDGAMKKGPIKSVGDLLPRLEAAAVILSALAIKPGFVPGYSRDAVLHELRQIRRMSGLSLQVLTGEIPDIDGEAVHEALVHILEPGPPAEPPQYNAYTLVDEDDDVAEGEIL